VDNFDYSQPFQQLADRGWAVVEYQSIVVVLHPGGVVLEGDHHEIVPEHAFEIVEGVSELWICYPLTEEETHQYGVRGAMMTQVLHCPYCHETDIVRHGKSPEGKQRYRCRQCLEGDGRTFLLEYAYAGQSPAIKQQIVDMAMNASGIRDTARVLHISPTTVIKE